ncbi:MAG: YggT family protein [Gammaproteobacteria bacterium]|nr:YggT family protein [Gammaproteobacteria bacterium]
MDALIFIFESVLSLAVVAFLLRFLLPLMRADFRNPLSQAVLSLTNWLVLPLRRVLPPIGRMDTASLVALVAVQLLATLLMFRLRAGALIPFVPLVVAGLRSLVISTIRLLQVLIFVYALLSFIAPGTYSPVVGLLSSLCEPLLRPLRRVLPLIGGLDFSPLVALIGLQALLILIA